MKQNTDILSRKKIKKFHAFKNDEMKFNVNYLKNIAKIYCICLVFLQSWDGLTKGFQDVCSFGQILESWLGKTNFSTTL